MSGIVFRDDCLTVPVAALDPDSAPSRVRQKSARRSAKMVRRMAKECQTTAKDRLGRQRSPEDLESLAIRAAPLELYRLLFQCSQLERKLSRIRIETVGRRVQLERLPGI